MTPRRNQEKTAFITKHVAMGNLRPSDGMWLVLNREHQTDEEEYEYLIHTLQGVVFSVGPKQKQPSKCLKEFERKDIRRCNVMCTLQMDELILTGNEDATISFFSVSKSESHRAWREIVHQQTVKFDATLDLPILSLQACPGQSLTDSSSQMKVIVICYKKLFFVLVERVVGESIRNFSETKRYSVRAVHAIEVDIYVSSTCHPLTWFGQDFVVMCHRERKSDESGLRLYEWKSSDVNTVIDCGYLLHSKLKSTDKISCSPRSYENRSFLVYFNLSSGIIEVWSTTDDEGGRKITKVISFLKHTTIGCLGHGSTVSWMPSENLTGLMDIPILASWGHSYRTSSSNENSSEIVFIWNATTGDVLHQLRLEEHVHMHNISFAPTRNLFATRTLAQQMPNKEDKLKIFSYEKQPNGELHVSLKDEITMHPDLAGGVWWHFSWHANGKILARMHDTNGEGTRVTFWEDRIS